MQPWFASLSSLDWVFITVAAVGGLVVLLRTALLFAGWGLDLDGDEFGDGHGDDHGDHGDGFHILTVHGLSSFFMMFGLAGFALVRSRAGTGGAILGGVLAGLAAIWVIARLFGTARRLQSSGTLQSQDAAGCLGTVYLTIPAGGTGRVNVRIGQRLREMDAIHAGSGDLPTGTTVRVLRLERAVAVVEPFSSTEPSCSNM